MNSRELLPLRVTLLVLGATCMALGPLMLYWPTGWRWEPYQPHYEQMMVGLYFTLGAFLIRASRDPLRHLSVIWFAVWSSVVHASVMTVQSFTGAQHHGHLVGDVPALFFAAAVVAFLTTRASRQAASP